MDGVDTIFDRNTNRAYTGKMRILDNSGKINGELELLNGRMHGEELYFEDGKVIEKNLWGDGKFIKNLQSTSFYYCNALTFEFQQSSLCE